MTAKRSIFMSACMSGFSARSSVLRSVDDEIIARREHRFGFAAERGDQARTRLAGPWRPRRKIERIQVAVARHGQCAALGFERNRTLARREIVQNHGCRGQRGMPAKIDFHRRREPAQFVARCHCDEERRLGEIVLGRDSLHLVIGQPRFQADKPRRDCRRTPVRQTRPPGTSEFSARS